MNYNINFQVAAVIITALLLYHFLTQKKLHNANVKTFTYILVLSGLYILSDLLGTLTIMNYTAEDEGTVMGILTGIYLLDILIPYILYSCIPDSRIRKILHSFAETFTVFSCHCLSNLKLKIFR